MKRGWLVIGVLVGFEGVAAIWAYIVFMATVGRVALPWVEQFIKWLFGS